LVNAYVSAGQNPDAVTSLPVAGILVTLSAFVMLYKSYQARGYLNFLGAEAKRGSMREELLGLDGWPSARVSHWRRTVWVCPWLRSPGDLLEPYLLLPAFILFAWVRILLRQWTLLPPLTTLGLAALLAIVVLFLFCAAWVWSQGMDEKERM